jgi:hypothetical protein
MIKIARLMASIMVMTILSTEILANENPYHGKKASAYLVGDYMNVDAAKAKLIAGGYEVLGVYAPVKKGATIVFTDAALKKEAAKPNRSHVALLRMFVDEREKTISVTNPIYFGKAFMQEEFNYDVFAHELSQINKTLGGLEESADALNFDDLGEYHFMINMPYYSDVVEIGDGVHEELLSKARDYKKGKLLLFELKLSKNSTIVAYDLSKRTKKFVEKIGRENASVLPYCVSIEGEKATIMDAKYYLAIAYPSLSMAQFTTIATVPGAISKELAQTFR